MTTNQLPAPEAQRIEVAQGAAIELRLFAPAAGPAAGAVLIGRAMERGTRVLVGCDGDAPRRVERVAPADVAARGIGHFGLFRGAFAPALRARTEGLLSEFKLAKETTT